MDREILEKYRKAGKIASVVRKEVLQMLKPGVRILDVAAFVEKRIHELGGKPAFPTNIGINDVTAHYTPAANDEKTIGEGDIVKVDFGVHIDGYIADTAISYSSEKKDLIRVAERALEAGIKQAKPGAKVSEISDAIHSVVESEGLGVIVNLTGHGIRRYDLHSSPTIPNVRNDSEYELQEGEVIALEPFVCERNSMVKESESIEIFSFVVPKPVRLPEARKILEIAKNEYNGLPLCKRWLVAKGFSQLKVSLALRQLEAIGSIHTYPVLRETEGKPVAQAEHTVIVLDKPITITNL